MIDFDPNVEDVLMPQDLAMKFMVWAGYYNSLTFEPGKSFSRFGKFSDEDVRRLDRLQAVLFRCFDEASVARAMNNITQAKQYGEPCPFSEDSLDALFGHTVK